MAVLQMDLGADSYDIVIERGALQQAKNLLNLERKVLVLTDDGVPQEYAAVVAAQAKDGFVYTIPQGEDSKSIPQFSAILSKMLELGFSRRDAVVAVGGGVVGDLAGFVASAYMQHPDDSIIASRQLYRRQDGGESRRHQEYRRRILPAEKSVG